jgi:hypothetical protein
MNLKIITKAQAMKIAGHTLVILTCLMDPILAHSQVPVSLGPMPRATFFSATGPLANGYVCTYAAGTSTPQATYTDSTGLVANANPVVLDANGSASIWFTASAYKIVLRQPGGDGTCGAGGGTVIYTTDNFIIAPFLAANNSWTGNQTFAGTSTFNGAVAFNAGGSITGAFTGSPTFSGNPTFGGTPSFSGNPTFSGVPVFTNALKTDLIDGVLTTGGTLGIQGTTGSGSSAGETISLAGGAGGPAGGAGGTVTFQGGAATSGNSAGGGISANGNLGIGTGPGGSFTFLGGTGGNTGAIGGSFTATAGPGGAGGNGGNISLITGTKGAGGLNGYIAFGGSAQIRDTVNITAVAPTCATTGNTGVGNSCALANYSTDTSGTVILTGGSTASATGTLTLTFNQTMGTNGSFCVWSLHNGTGTWVATSSIIGGTYASATATAIWTNGGATSLVSTNTYDIDYWCRGEN